MTTQNRSAAALLRQMREQGSTASPAAEGREDRRYLQDVLTAAEGADRSGDGQDLTDAAAVVSMILAESLKSAAAALKSATVDPSKVTLRTDGKKVTANLPVMVPVMTADGRERSLCVNVNTSFHVGDVIGSRLQRFAARKG